MNEKFLENDTTPFSVDNKSKSSLSTTILWITFVLSLIATIFFYMQSTSLANSVVESEQTRDEIVTQLASPSYVQIEEKATAFKNAYSILSEINTTRLPKKELLTELYTYFTKDVAIRNIAISDDGTLTIDGNTASYRAVADFMVGLASYERISDLTLGTVATLNTKDIPLNKAVIFSLTSKIDLKKSNEATTPETSATDDFDATSGSFTSEEDY